MPLLKETTVLLCSIQQTFFLRFYSDFWFQLLANPYFFNIPDLLDW